MNTEEFLLIRRHYNKFRKAVEHGLGTDIEKLAKQIRADKFVKLMEIYIGQCDCEKRKAALNRFPSAIEKIKGWAKEITE